ncbi:kinase-like domain-containing protein [Tanacetum coccineum]|uniref:Kinase-like domain-containing protein n=1 Tax=Tanacetum coccineum TaxID=301880 RepID=A0ABQ5DAX4_9ASTR
MSLPSHEFAHLIAPLQNILSATNNFAQENAITSSRFAKNYRGQLLWSGELIDITAQRFNKERNDREQQFWMEISMLSSLKHKNLVSLVGFCDENDEKIIIYKNETARGLLYKYISDPMLLNWRCEDGDIVDLGIHGLELVIVAIGKKLVVAFVGIVETVPASSTRWGDS